MCSETRSEVVLSKLVVVHAQGEITNLKVVGFFYLHGAVSTFTSVNLPLKMTLYHCLKKKTCGNQR